MRGGGPWQTYPLTWVYPRAGSIPARAGEPPCLSEGAQERGNPRRDRARLHRVGPSGLSPRGRGNLERRHPRWGLSPRRGRLGKGLSPRGRGNHKPGVFTRVYRAGGGTRSQSGQVGSCRYPRAGGGTVWVYPRAGGGTTFLPAQRSHLSPRGRGNAAGERRSIPARAGEPHQPAGRSRSMSSRGLGGRGNPEMVAREGLSPRGRGNHRLGVAAGVYPRLKLAGEPRARYGSIPARAGEPGRPAYLKPWPAGGGTVRRHTLGLSPRGRGNLDNDARR